ncbi:MAG TPA: hypothetical protein VM901_11080 [Bdellovibrionota bacterium]|jgi:glycosyl-4,4'-diaponeurosporenoate acyltransferase|nr:hypothetical protein [Bdellovibrionota bacterium]
MVWIANLLGWPILHLLVSKIFTDLPLRIFDPNSPLFRERRWELGGDLYSRGLRIKFWKSHLPDAAAWFRGGFPKGKILSREPAYLERFARETCRGEAAHWVTLATCPIFFIWNPLWAKLVMLAYAVLANLPCICALRYNRIVIRRRLQRSS